MKKLLLIILIFICACSSNKKNNERAVARVLDKFLYLNDLQGVIPKNVFGKDSVALINDYIDNWIRQQLLISQAERNLSAEQRDFTKQLEDYKNSLTIYRYESELIKQSLDTNVAENEIEDYYEKNKSNFELKENIVKVIYVKVPNNSPISTARLYIRSDNVQDRKKLQDFCHKYAVNYYLEDGNWLLFNDILKEIPINTYNQEDYLKNNRLIEIKDSNFIYLLNIKGFMIKEGLSPLSFEKGNIRDIIINKRKLKLIETMQNDVYNKALKKGDFEIINK
ncbi:MAG: hypothetical protein WCQ95_04040 [Bacteroidota bacterium]